MRRPALVAIATSALILVLALPFLGVRFTGVDARVLPRVGERAPRRPTSCARTSPPAPTRRSRWSCTAARRPPSRVASRALPDVAAVAPPRPLGRGSGRRRGDPARGRDGRRDEDARARASARLPDVRSAGGPRGSSTRRTRSCTRLPLALAILVAAELVLLFFVTRSFVLPVKAVVMNVLGVLAAFGILVFVFQDGRLEGLLGYRERARARADPAGAARAIAFGLATDYGVFLLARIREAHDDGLANREAVALGLERTGPRDHRGGAALLRRGRLVRHARTC